MLDRVIHWSLNNRMVVLALALVLVVWGIWTTVRMPIDVFPDLTAPTITIIADAHSLATEEVETLVTLPIETALNGVTGVRRVRSSSAPGVAIVYVEFEWDTDIFRARQLVNEKLQVARSSLPPDLPSPVLAPISSIMGEIMFIAMKADNPAISPLLVRSTADWVVRRRLLAIPGVSQVIPIGGDVKQVQVLVDPTRLMTRGLTLKQVTDALRNSNQNVSGGFLDHGGQAYMIRGFGRVQRAEELKNVVVSVRNGTAMTVGDLAQVVNGAGPKWGEGSLNGQPAVIIAILKQPDANTLELTRRVDAVLDALTPSLPPGVSLDRQNFRQADFIDRAVGNVEDALRDGAILVVAILFIFLLNARATVISLLAIPLSLLTAVLCLKALGGSINTMTLGGLTIAIGALVDDAIIDVENVHRRLHEERLKPMSEQRPALSVIYAASCEVRGAIFFATLIIMLVFVPFFFLSGVEGRLLQPLGFAYIVAIFASLVVALTLTPVACYYLLGNQGAHTSRGDSWVIRGLKRFYAPILKCAIAHPNWVLAISTTGLIIALMTIPWLGRSFLPEFNEGSLTINATTLPGTSLPKSDELGRRLEHILGEFPEVVSTSRRTGRAELDEHAQGVHSSEIDVVFHLGDRTKEGFLDALRQAVTPLPMQINFGGPLAHRIDHMLSGTRSNVAIKIFGEDLTELHNLGEQVAFSIRRIPGVVDLTTEQQINVPQLAIRYHPNALARHGLTTGDIGLNLETALQGSVVSRMLEGQKTHDIVVRFPSRYRASKETIQDLLISLPNGASAPLATLASVGVEQGPTLINRENVQRKLVVSCNVAGRDLVGTVADIQEAIGKQLRIPAGYHIEYGGQIESAETASRVLGILTTGVILGITGLLIIALGNWRSALIIMANLPLALIGGIFAVRLTDGILSVASLVGFITLFGIATRNGLMLVSHYQHLMIHENEGVQPAIIRGSLERLSPILMTALTAGLALIPVIVRAHEPGNEIQAPMATVILGGLLSATFLNMIVIPALYLKFGQPESTRTQSPNSGQTN